MRPAEYRAETKPAPRGHFTGLQSEHIFIPCMLAFLATMTLVITSRNFGLLWVAVEATTLVSAPLICFHRSDRSLEAMWKYLLICSVGIGLALFGTMLMAVSAQSAEERAVQQGTGEQGGDRSGRFAVRIRQPRVERSEPHLRSVARKNENERALEPAEVEFIRVCLLPKPNKW